MQRVAEAIETLEVRNTSLSPLQWNKRRGIKAGLKKKKSDTDRFSELLLITAGPELRVTGLEIDEVLNPSYTAGAPGLYSVCRILIVPDASGVTCQEKMQAHMSVDVAPATPTEW